MIPKENSIAIQSKELFAEALVDLLRTKPYHKINITELAQKADLDRRTFYRNFNFKDDILAYRIKGIIEEFQESIHQQKHLDAYIIAKTYFAVCSHHVDFLTLLSEQGLMIHLLSAFDQVLPSLTEKYVRRAVDESEDDFAYVLSFYAGGFWHLSNKWLQEGIQKTPDQLAALVPIVMKRLIMDI
jgi:AcrR family transcriptional regulator